MKLHFSRVLSSIAIFITLFLLTGLQSGVAETEDGIRTTDYFVTHTSTEPFYGKHNLDPTVVLHVREVVLAGRERTVGQSGKVLVLVHGATFPGSVAFDTDFENVSLMRHFAKLGWDTFALDLQGFGSSTRPLSMDNPAAFPDDPAPMRAEVTTADVDRVVDFVRDLRAVDKVHLLGWSLGASVEAPLYTIEYPNKVASLVLYGVNYQGWGDSEDEVKKRVESYNSQKFRLSYPSSVQRWSGLGTKAEWVIPGAFEAYRIAHLASDPKSGELGGAIRAPEGRSISLALTEPHFDATKITVPTLVIRGDSDTFAKQEDNQALLEALGSEKKQLVEIPNAGHFMHFENVNMQFYQALQDFLEAKE